MLWRDETLWEQGLLQPLYIFLYLRNQEKNKMTADLHRQMIKITATFSSSDIYVNMNVIRCSQGMHDILPLLYSWNCLSTPLLDLNMRKSALLVETSVTRRLHASRGKLNGLNGTKCEIEKKTSRLLTRRISEFPDRSQQTCLNT